MDSSDVLCSDSTNEHTAKKSLVNPKPSSSSEGNTSTLGAIFLIVNASLGAGLLNFPHAFDQAGGFLTVVLVQAFLLVFIMAALLILAQASDMHQVATLQEVMYTVVGPWGRRVTAAIVSVYCFGEIGSVCQFFIRLYFLYLQALASPS